MLSADFLNLSFCCFRTSLQNIPPNSHPSIGGIEYAAMMEWVDIADLKSAWGNSVPVRVRLAAPFLDLRAENSALRFLLICQNGKDGVGRGQLIILIQVCIDVCGSSDCAMTKPCLDFFQTHSLCKEKGSATMPLRYNKDKRKNPVFSRVSAFVVAYSIPFPTLIVNEKSVEEYCCSGAVFYRTAAYQGVSSDLMGALFLRPFSEIGGNLHGTE